MGRVCFECEMMSLVMQDESLFGPPARLKQMTGNRTWTASEGESVMGEEKGKRQRRVSNDPEVMQLVTKDLIRNLR